ncbi:hypothetical protein [Methylosinus sporium]|uniref:hypothetical protein n=1 Tax=Methylosinus sporium TaxID=428 RepID=UPI00163DBC76|nr:hypothetical protein [Methylosinus sporium]
MAPTLMSKSNCPNRTCIRARFTLLLLIGLGLRIGRSPGRRIPDTSRTSRSGHALAYLHETPDNHTVFRRTNGAHIFLEYGEAKLPFSRSGGGFTLSEFGILRHEIVLGVIEPLL